MMTLTAMNLKKVSILTSFSHRLFLYARWKRAFLVQWFSKGELSFNTKKDQAFILNARSYQIKSIS